MELGRECRRLACDICMDLTFMIDCCALLSPPILEVQQGDDVHIHAINRLGEGTTTSLHHHGLFFRGEDGSALGMYDGAPGFTQCGIPYNQSLEYIVPVFEETGTYCESSHEW